MNRFLASVVLIVAGLTLVWIQPAPAADRDKLLADPGVYGTYAVFKVDEDWWKLDKAARAKAAAEVVEVFQKHAATVAVDTYLLRGLSDHADFLVRVHATELAHNQNFLVDFMGTILGTHLDGTHIFNGLTKKANYVPGFPDTMKTDLKAPAEPGDKTYAIVVPIKKDADWWAASPEDRAAMMQEHTAAAIPYLKTVKRKLYHSSGLDDLDFLTYFETSRMDDFHSLILALERVKENKHNKRFGHPTLVGTIAPLDKILDILKR